MKGYIHKKSRLVMLYHKVLCCWEIYQINKNNQINRGIAPLILYNEDKREVLRMANLLRGFPLRNWKEVNGDSNCWEGMIENMWSTAYNNLAHT